MRTLISRSEMFASALLAILLLAAPCLGQSLGNAGTIQSTVLDPSGAAVADAEVSVLNRISGYKQSTTTDSTGSFRLSNIPPNPYHFEVKAPGFAVFSQDVDVRGSIPVTLLPKLALAGGSTTVTVEAAGADLLELDPSAHIDVDRSLINKLPVSSPGSGLSDAITYGTGASPRMPTAFFIHLATMLRFRLLSTANPFPISRPRFSPRSFPPALPKAWS